MAPRATWKGTLKLGFLSCPVGLYTAVGEGDEIHFNMVNRRSGHRLRRLFVDSGTGKPVERDHQVKGYEVDTDRYVVLTEEEIEAAIPDSTKTIDIEAFVPRDQVDRVAIDRPYYLAPADAVGAEAFAVIRAACEKAGAVGIGRTVLFRRDRVVMLCPEGPGFLANLLHFEYEMRDEAQAFDDIPNVKIAGEMLDLAKHIIGQKKGKFEPGQVRGPLRDGADGADPGQAARRDDQGAGGAEARPGDRPDGGPARERGGRREVRPQDCGEIQDRGEVQDRRQDEAQGHTASTTRRKAS